MSDAIETVMTVVLTVASTPVYEFAKKYGLKHLADRVKGFAGSGMVAVNQTVALSYQEWTIDLAAWIPYLFEQQLKQGADLNELREMVERNAVSDDSRRILTAFAFEAMREALPARKEMLGAAAAYLTMMDLPLEEKARAERAIRQLDTRT